MDATGSTVTINCRQIACDFYSRTRLLHKIITIIIYLLYLFLVAHSHIIIICFIPFLLADAPSEIHSLIIIQSAPDTIRPPLALSFAFFKGQ